MSRAIPNWADYAVTEVQRLGRRVLTRQDLVTILTALRIDGIIPPATSLARLLEVLNRALGLREHVIPARGSDNPEENAPYRPFKRYIFGAPTAAEVALSLRPRSYLSHNSALRLHGLTTQHDPTVYVNQEQSPKPVSRGRLDQSAIDRAFQNHPRVSRYVFRYDGADLVLIAGKSSGNFGVIEVPDPAIGTPVPVTSIARTLVDVAVRPVYAGGPSAVLAAYRRAIQAVPLDALIGDILTSLKALGHIYPYHQTIGFYLTQAGAPVESTRAFAALGLTYDFYLAHRIAEPVLDYTWHVWVPAGIATDSA